MEKLYINVNTLNLDVYDLIMIQKDDAIGSISLETIESIQKKENQECSNVLGSKIKSFVTYIYNTQNFSLVYSNNENNSSISIDPSYKVVGVWKFDSITKDYKCYFYNPDNNDSFFIDDMETYKIKYNDLNKSWTHEFMENLSNAEEKDKDEFERQIEMAITNHLGTNHWGYKEFDWTKNYCVVCIDNTIAAG